VETLSHPRARNRPDPETGLAVDASGYATYVAPTVTFVGKRDSQVHVPRRIHAGSLLGYHCSDMVTPSHRRLLAIKKQSWMEKRVDDGSWGRRVLILDSSGRVSYHKYEILPPRWSRHVVKRGGWEPEHGCNIDFRNWRKFYYRNKDTKQTARERPVISTDSRHQSPGDKRCLKQLQSTGNSRREFHVSEITGISKPRSNFLSSSNYLTIATRTPDKKGPTYCFWFESKELATEWRDVLLPPGWKSQVVPALRGGTATFYWNTRDPQNAGWNPDPLNSDKRPAKCQWEHPLHANL